MALFVTVYEYPLTLLVMLECICEESRTLKTFKFGKGNFQHRHLLTNRTRLLEVWEDGPVLQILKMSGKGVLHGWTKCPIRPNLFWKCTASTQKHSGILSAEIQINFWRPVEQVSNRQTNRWIIVSQLIYISVHLINKHEVIVHVNIPAILHLRIV